MSCNSLVADKFRITSREDYSDYTLYESLENGKCKCILLPTILVVTPVPVTSFPLEIASKWTKPDTSKFLFKKGEGNSKSIGFKF
jgi:hypothetical protein